MEIEENFNGAAFTGLENSVVAQSKPIYLLFKRLTDFVLALLGLVHPVAGVYDCGNLDQMG